MPPTSMRAHGRKASLRSKIDEAFLTECFSNAAGSPATLGKYTDATGTVRENYYLINFNPIDFADYLD